MATGNPAATGDPGEMTLSMGAGPMGTGPMGSGPMRVGARLGEARSAAGFDLGDVATRTRIPLRHLEAIERSDYDALPAPTYAVGFARAYARAVGVDEVGIAHDVRAELGREPVRSPEAKPYDPVDPSRVPPKLLAWTALAIAVAFLVGWLVWRNMFFSDTPISYGAPIATGSAVATAPGAGTPSTTVPIAPAGGQVVLTATSPVWAQITDATGEKFVLRELKTGESFAVPKTADRPVITTGRPNALRVTIDGREIAPLGEPERRIQDVGISAAALAARAGVGQTAAGSRREER